MRILFSLFFSVIIFSSCKKTYNSRNTNAECPFVFVGCIKNNSFQESSITKHEIENGIVPDSQTAVNIAYIYAKKIFPDEIDQELPLKVTLINDSIWMVEGSGKYQSVEAKQGKMSMLIKKSNGKVLYIYHSE